MSESFSLLTLEPFPLPCVCAGFKAILDAYWSIWHYLVDIFLKLWHQLPPYKVLSQLISPTVVLHHCVVLHYDVDVITDEADLETDEVIKEEELMQLCETFQEEMGLDPLEGAKTKLAARNLWMEYFTSGDPNHKHDGHWAHNKTKPL